MTVIEKQLPEGDVQLRATPGQTIGPFFKFGLEYDGGPYVVAPHTPGSVFLRGNVYDGDGYAIPDAIVEIFGADTDGTIPQARGSLRRDGHTFTGWGRSATSDEGRYFFWTREPGAVEPGSAPFFAAVLFARGLPHKLHTRIYLPDDEEALAGDPLLSTLSETERASLIATRDEDGSLRHDLWMQGEKETIFLAY